MTKNVIIVDNEVATRRDLTRGHDHGSFDCGGLHAVLVHAGGAAGDRSAVRRDDAELSGAKAIDLVLFDLGEHSCGSAGCRQPFEREHLQEVIGPLLR